MNNIDMGDYFAALGIDGVDDWRDTPLGPPEEWSDALHLAVRAMAQTPVPAVITLKAGGGMTYNAAFAAIIGAQHPMAFGNDAAQLRHRAGCEWRLSGRRFTVRDFPVPGLPDAILSILFPRDIPALIDGTVCPALSDGPTPDMLGISYQPQVRLRDNKMVGLEALARWHHPEYGEIAPSHFIALAEKSNLILEIGDWVVARALSDVSAFHECHALRVAVNVSPLQLRNPGFVAHVQRTLAASAIPAPFLELEITETLLIEQDETATRSLQGLRDLGVTLALDDFGTGYSNLATLARVRFDRLKLDRSLLRDFSGARTQTLIRCTIDMAHDLGMDVVVEGIEDAMQHDFLRDIGCDYGQGYLYAPPMPLNDALAWKSAREDERAAMSDLQVHG